MLILPMPPDGADVVAAAARVAGGDNVGGADETRIRQARRTAYLLALQLLGDRDLARDVAQEAMLRFHRHQGRLDAARPVRPWLLQVVRNLVRDQWRRQQVRRTRSLDTAEPSLAGEMRTPEAGPEEVLLLHERRRRLWAALAHLTPAQREILVLRDFHDLTYEQLAAVLKIPTGTVMSRLHGARRSLRDLLAVRREGY